MSRELNIYLVGLPGSGKTTIGRALAKKLGKDFFDSDQFLIERTGVSIKTIFDLEGEDGFRKREKKVLEEIASRCNIVLATGGGSILDKESRILLNRTGFVIYLKAEPEFLFKRMEKDTSRPLLQGLNPLEKLIDLYEERLPLYHEVSHKVYLVNEETPPFYFCVQELIEIIENRVKTC